MKWVFNEVIILARQQETHNIMTNKKATSRHCLKRLRVALRSGPCPFSFHREKLLWAANLWRVSTLLHLTLVPRVLARLYQPLAEVCNMSNGIILQAFKFNRSPITRA